MENSLKMSHKVIEECVNCTSVVIDATCGAGNDTLFLAKLAKKVYAFDIQLDAINKTKEKCANFNNITYINDSHENVLMYVSDMVDAAIFNLGYLPKSNHAIFTKSASTIKAINAILSILNEGGRISIVAYPGFKEGKEEKEALEEYLKTLDQKTYNAPKYEFLNQINDPPILYVIERISL